MASTSFTSFLPEVLPLVPGCSDVLALNAIRNAAIEFCSVTMYWQETQDTVTISPDEFPYDLEAPSGARVLQPLAVIVGGNPVPSRSVDWLDSNIPNWRSQTAATPAHYYQPNPTQLVFVPAPDGEVEVTFRLAYAPTRAASGIEDWVFQNYVEWIASGALSRLLALPGQAWTNDALAAYHRGLFNTALTEATVAANKSYGRGTTQVQFRNFS